MYIEKIIEKALETKINESQKIDLDVLKNLSNQEWECCVRYLESKGFSVALETKNFPEGIYIAEGLDENKKPKGWKLENEELISIIIKNIGLPLLSKKPEEPNIEKGGIDLIPFYNMAIIVGNNEKWEKPQIIPASAFSMIIGETTCIQYGQSAFEGCCSMKNENNEIFNFRIGENAKRFKKSINFLGFPDIDEKLIESLINKVVKLNKNYVPEKGKLYIRPSVNGLDKGLGLNPPAHQIITIEIAAFSDYLPESIKIEGLKNVSRPNTGSNKVAPNYGASFNIKKGVKQRGYSDYLSFTKDGLVEEVSTCAVGFIDQEENFVFPPVINEIDKKPRNILPSITRKSVIDILKKQGKSVVIRDVHADEIKKMKDMFTMGNAVGILKINEICLKENFEDNGEITIFNNPDTTQIIKTIKDDLYQARTGNLQGFEHWVEKI